MVFAVLAVLLAGAFLLLRTAFSSEKNTCPAAIVIVCGRDNEGLRRQVCAYHHDEQAEGGVYRRRILLLSPDGSFSREARELAEDFEDVFLTSAEELAEDIMQGDRE